MIKEKTPKAFQYENKKNTPRRKVQIKTGTKIRKYTTQRKGQGIKLRIAAIALRVQTPNKTDGEIYLFDGPRISVKPRIIE